MLWWRWLWPSLLSGGCQSPTDPDDVIGVDDFVDASSSPDPATADASSGRTYRVVRGNNQPDEILEFDWKTSFTVTIRLNDTANDSDLDLAFPVDITAATVKVQQATGGIVSPPTGGELEYQDYVIAQTSGNRYAGCQFVPQHHLRHLVRLAQPEEGSAHHRDRSD